MLMAFLKAEEFLAPTYICHILRRRLQESDIVHILEMKLYYDPLIIYVHNEHI
jgi:hypothetical protein